MVVWRSGYSGRNPWQSAMMRDSGSLCSWMSFVYSLGVDNKKLGIRNVRYFSPDCLGPLRHTLDQASQLLVDYGW
jgi:hypothetical protein